ncbi:MAG: pirin family protein [Proteobacteria bacterium]|nr:pirin family protein [Pseudomonadota bacterium]
MSWQPAATADAGDVGSCAAVETVIVPRARDLGGFSVRRVLPAIARRMVGPFVFLDQMGPVDFPAGTGIDVRPHPHIGLATVTYLFAGSMVHRDSVGSVQTIAPGDVNWMTAGSGIVHSERSDGERRQRPQTVSGIQIWVALPARDEETAPHFAHHPAASLPVIAGEGKTLRVVAGSIFGRTAPVATLSELFYADVTLAPGASLPLDADHEERAAYLLEGTVAVDGQSFAPGRLLVFAPRARPTLSAAGPAHLLLLGGAKLDGPRHIWWNFVSSRRERIEQAKDDWKHRRFAPIPGETEFIPLPDGP